MRECVRRVKPALAGEHFPLFPIFQRTLASMAAKTTPQYLSPNLSWGNGNLST